MAVVNPTQADREAAVRLSYFGLPVEVVAAKYTDAEMWEFKDRITPLMPREVPEDQPYVFGVGFAVRGNDWSANGQPVVRVLVTSAEPHLVARIQELVPEDALEISVGRPLRRH